MRILLTGASSFTGAWFAKSLVDAGHEVVATFRAEQDGYVDLRARRIRMVGGVVEPVWACPFGSDRFLALLNNRRFDVLCHHAAEMAGYRSWDFDWLEACRKNTMFARATINALAEKDACGIILTGTVFEPYEGIGDPQQRSILPYGLAKHTTFEAFRLEADRVGLAVGKFVIPNPFGPFEEPRFTSYLAREWAAGRVPVVRTPLYVRDNIPVSKLALSYAAFCTRVSEASMNLRRCRPSGYVESQGAFAYRCARELGARSGRTFSIAIGEQKELEEPRTRINPSAPADDVAGWSEWGAWDALHEFYKQAFGLP